MMHGGHLEVEKALATPPTSSPLANKLSKEPKMSSMENDSLEENSLFSSPLTSDIPGAPMESRMNEFLNNVSVLLRDYVSTQIDRSLPVTRLRSPQELQDEFSATGVSLSLDDAQKPMDLTKLFKACQTTLDLSVRTGHPLFFNQLYARADTVGVAAEWLTVAAHTAVHTYEVSPVFTVMEREIVRKVAAVIGGQYLKSSCSVCPSSSRASQPEPACDGLFVPGGSISNLYSLHLARHRVDPEYRERGAFGGPHLVAFVSKHAHYSFQKAVMVTGIGTRNLILVDVDEQGRMIPERLVELIEEAKQQGKTPFFVGATSGTTVLGAFDPVEPLAKICKQYSMWLHVDACWGGSVLFSPKYRHLLKGVDEADSIAWNPHKLMGAPMQCSLLVTRHRRILETCNACHASYLFQPDKNFADYDIGDKTIQCGRRPDVFKLWCMWKAYGDEQLCRQVEYAVDLAKYMEQKIISLSVETPLTDASSGPAAANRGAFALVFPRTYVNVCFWFIPPSLRPFSREKATVEQWEKLGKVAPIMKDRMQRAGDAMIGFQPIEKYPNFFRIVFASPWRVTKEDLDGVLERMIKIGSDL